MEEVSNNQVESKKINKIFDFLKQDMAKALIAADLVLTRAGGNTLSECIYLKKPAIIIPLQKSANNQDPQRRHTS